MLVVEVFPHGHGKRQKYEVRICVDFKDGSPWHWVSDGMFDSGMDAHERAKMVRGEIARVGEHEYARMISRHKQSPIVTILNHAVGLTFRTTLCIRQ